MFDQFSDREEREKAERLKTKRCKQKLEENKIKEAEMQNRLNELNRELKKSNASIKEEKRISSTIIR